MVARKSIPLLVIGLTLQAVPLAGLAQITLPDVYLSAMATNEGVMSKELQEQAKEESVREAWGKVLPQVDATASYGVSEYTRNFDRASSITETDTLTRADVQLDQVIYSRETFKEIERAGASADLAGAERRARELEVGFNAIEAYLEANRLQAETDVLEDSLASHQRRLKQMESMQERGLASRSETLDARARMDEVEAELASLRYDYRAAIKNLEAVSGLDVDQKQLAPLPVGVWKRTPAVLDKDWQSLAFSNSAEISRAKREREVADATYERERGAHWPELYLSAQYSNNDTFATTLREELRAELQLRVPLYSGGSTSARARAAHKRERAAEYELRHRKDRVQVEVSRLTETLQGSYQKIRSLKTAESSAEAALEAAQKGFQSGVRSLNDLLDSRNRLTDIRRSLIEQTHKNVMRQYELRQRTGTLSVQDLPGLASAAGQ
ncbi:TolC family protein [Vreelandella utahensis]|uniref:TolC family protein n=1 Tax=Vreelandella halophila TaxID=86177 RepID=UPI0009851CDB|nr:TolC family protein [Halomonas utahensis]